MATITGAVSKAYISSLNFLDKRDYLNQVFDTTGETPTMVDDLELTQRMQVTDVPSFRHTEAQYRFKAANILSVGAEDGQSAGEALDVVFDATAEAYDGALAGHGGDAAYPVPGELAMLPSKKIGRVYSVSTNTAKIKPLRATDILNPGGTTVVAEQKIIFFSGTFGDGSGDPTTRQPEWVLSENTVQIHKEAGEITGLQKVSAVEVNYKGKPYLMYKVQWDTYLRHKMKMAGAFLFGKQASGLDADGKTWYTTQGLRSYIFEGDGVTKTTGGVTKQVTTLDFATDWLDLSRKLDKNQAPKEYWAYIGGDLNAALDLELADLNGIKNSLDFSSFGSGNASKRAVDLGFDSFRIFNRTYHKKQLAFLDHKGLYGAPGFDFASEAYLVPTDKIKIDGGNEVSDRIRMRIMSGDGTNFYPHHEAVTGKLAPTPTNTTSVLHISYETVAGLQVCGTEHFAAIYKS